MPQTKKNHNTSRELIDNPSFLSSQDQNAPVNTSRASHNSLKEWLEIEGDPNQTIDEGR